MNEPPKLYGLAFEIVANCYTIDLFPIKIPHDTIVSDEVFKAVMKIRDYSYDAHTKVLLNEFKPTKLELDLNNSKQGSFSEIQKLELTELKIRNFCEIDKYVVRVAGSEQSEFTYGVSRGPVISYGFSSSSDDDDDHIDDDELNSSVSFSIAKFLGDILSEESRRQLRVLDISGYEPFGDKWMEEVSSMFPKLEVLNINKRKFSKDEFAILCNNLTNLQTLRIGHRNLVTLNGISKLENLKNLAIEKYNFWNKEAVEDLFRVKNLKTLSFSNNLYGLWDYNFYFEKLLPELTHLEIKWVEADDSFLKGILPKLPKLQDVVAHGTQIHENAAPPSVTVHAYNDLNAILKALALFRISGNREKTLEAISQFWEVYHWSDRRVCTPDQLTNCVNEVEALLGTFKFDKKVMKEVNACVEIFVCFAMGDGHLNENKLKIVSFLLRNLKYLFENRTSNFSEPLRDSIISNIWRDVNRFVENTENLNIDEIGALAMETIIHGDESIYLEQNCAKVLSEILDKMDLSSEYYKKIDFRKFHECLSVIHKTARWPERRANAGDVLRYIELFM